MCRTQSLEAITFASLLFAGWAIWREVHHMVEQANDLVTHVFGRG